MKKTIPVKQKVFKSREVAMSEIMSKVGFGSSDYGRSLLDFEKGFLRNVTPTTTVIVLGDTRTNNLDPRADILRRISERSKRLVWLNHGAIPRCLAMPPSAASCANARRPGSSSARCRIS